MSAQQARREWRGRARRDRRGRRGGGRTERRPAMIRGRTMKTMTWSLFLWATRPAQGALNQTSLLIWATRPAQGALNRALLMTMKWCLVLWATRPALGALNQTSLLIWAALHSYDFEGRIGAFEQRLGESASEAPSDPDLFGDLAGLQAPPRKAEDTPSLPGSGPKGVSAGGKPAGKPARVAAAFGAAEEPVVEPIAGSDARLEPEVTCHACKRAGHRVHVCPTTTFTPGQDESGADLPIMYMPCWGCEKWGHSKINCPSKSARSPLNGAARVEPGTKPR